MNKYERITHCNIDTIKKIFLSKRPVPRERHTDGQREIKRDREKERETERKREREKGREREREREREVNTSYHLVVF